ncbi:hypothetical protein JTE90_025702 [Oedothorax gibbosus]|uniref:Uncharacterized protein n=1 Tax=Oedothorax gibbosus TaxID=931172 RepID=A0AAV6UJ94_9ARAC|nr:hypothetical protein JTE90_025702 [Oedothorax gibbosus]
MYFPDLKKGELPKKKNFKGPYRILEAYNSVNYSVVDINDPRAKPQRVHSERLIPFEARNTQNNTNTDDAQFIDKNATLVKKPHAAFDTNDEEDQIPLYTFPKQRATLRENPTRVDDESEHDSDSTEIYEAAGGVEPTPLVTVPTPVTNIKYNLRTRTVVEKPREKAEQPTLVRLLDKLTDALK